MVETTSKGNNVYYCRICNKDVNGGVCERYQEERATATNSCKGCNNPKRFCVLCFHDKGKKKTYKVDPDTGLCAQCQQELDEHPIPKPSSGGGNGKEENKSEGKIVEIPIASLVPFSGQARKKFPSEDLDRLARSMDKKGQLEAIIVCPHPDQKGKFLIIGGERRYRVARYILQWETLKAVVVPIPGKKELRDKAAILNCCREGYTIPELIALIAELEEDYTQRDIAEMLGYSLGYISVTSRFRQLPKEVLAMLEPDAPEGMRINRNIAVELLKIPVEQTDFIIATARMLASEGIKAIEAPIIIAREAEKSGINLGSNGRKKDPNDFWHVISNLVTKTKRDLPTQLSASKETLDTAFSNRQPKELRQIIEDSRTAKELLERVSQLAKKALAKMGDTKSV